MSLLAELQRRNVIRVALGYLAGAWLLIQILETLFPIFGLPETSIRAVVVVIAIGLLPVLVLTWVFEWTPEGVRRDEGPAAKADSDSKRRFDRIVVLILLLAVGYFAVDKFVLDPSRDAAKVEQAREEGRVEAVLDQYQDTSIVVLPFTNMSPDADQEYFADGLSEELLNLLAQMPELRVISRSTAFTFKGKEIVIPEIAEKLNVSHVLEGSVRKSGSRVRITAQLIEARTDTHLWSQTYDRTLEDIFAIQDEISAAVVAQLEVVLLGDIPKAQAVDPRAYELYLQAHYIIEGDVRGDYDLAKGKLEEALVLEPRFLAALADLGRIYLFDPQYPEAERTASMYDVVERMVEIDPESSYTNAWRGYLTSRWEGDLQSAARYYELAIADDPFNPEPLLRAVASFLVDLRRLEEAEALIRFDLSRDPSCVNCINALAKVMRAQGRHRELAEQLEKVLEWQGPTLPIYTWLGVSWLIEGKPERALEYFDKLNDLEPGSGRFWRILALHDLGRHREFEAEFAAAREALASSPGDMARIYAWTGRNDDAFEWLRIMVEKEGPGSAVFTQTDFFRKLHSDPRWPAFLEQYGATEDDLSDIEFDPPYPEAMRTALDQYRQGR